MEVYCANCGKKILKKLKRQGNATLFYRLIYNDGSSHYLAVDTLYSKVKACAEKWLPIPSLNNSYEVSQSGKLRHSVTKRLIKKRKQGNSYRINIANKPSVSVDSLIWEVFGIINPPNNRTHVAVTLCKENFVKKFPSIRAAAHFLSDKVFLAPSTLIMKMFKRYREIYGWQIFYNESMI